MRKRGIVFLFLFLVLGLSLLSAQANSTEEVKKVNEAYQCLTDKVSGNCDSLSTSEKIFSLLSINNCKSQLLEDSSNSGECWPDSSSSVCDVKTTAQAVLALSSTGSSTSKAESWLLSQNRTPTQLTWYLEIESSGASSCNIQYSGSSHTISIGEDKKISSGAGPCLLLDSGGYWLRVSPTCYDTEFSISCNSDFLTTTLFKKSTSSTIHVSEKTSSASSGGTTTEKVESSCFAKNNACDYEGSLWAALVLDAEDEEISAYLPYLITLADENSRFLPDAFIYMITGNLENKLSLLAKQKNNQWWAESGDKHYDTALALYPFQSETPFEKTNSKDWLLDSQDSEGCWNGNIRNTGFLLASIWPEDFGGSGGTNLPDCETAGNFCTPAATCEGHILSEYDCLSSVHKCCDTEPLLKTCSELGGEICSSNQRCVGGNEADAADLFSGEVCCTEGSCSAVQETSECESNSGICRQNSCNSNEEEASYSCAFSGDLCCVLKNGEKRSYLWIWILLILIILVVLGIIFRNKLRILWMRMRRGRSKPGPSRRRPGPRPGPPPMLSRRIRRPLPRVPERRILLPAERPPARRAPRKPSGAQKELDQVLKKLKDMSK
jgi:hypothetical protein